jgi:hypothetical protein
MRELFIFILIGCSIMIALSAIGGKEKPDDEIEKNRVNYFKGQVK